MDFRFLSFTNVQRVIRLGMAAWAGVAFRQEFRDAFAGLYNRVLFKIPLTETSISALGKISGAAMLLLLIYALFVAWFVYFVLPISNTSQFLAGFWRMFIFGITLRRCRGPAVFVRNGEVIGGGEELVNKRPGVAFIDLRSAIVLDKLQTREDEEFAGNETAPSKVNFARFGFGRMYPAQIRVAGPGLVFTKKNERITGTVDLRNQSRGSGEIFADTRDGLRVSTKVNAGFTLGQNPDILDVCFGGDDMDKVFVIEWEKNLPPNTKRIKSLKANDLDPGDAEEVLQFSRANPYLYQTSTNLPPEKYPFIFDPKRVEQAVYSITNLNDPSRPGTKQWSDWAPDVVAEKFRILLSEIPLMSLYTPNETNKYPMKEFKQELMRVVRNTGMLAFRIVERVDGGRIQSGEDYLEAGLVFHPAQKFTRADVLRDRGIKVNSAGFGDLTPNEEVQKQLKNAWLSSKKKEEDIKTADSALEATRIKNHARVRARQSMNYHLAKILEKQEYPREALAILVFQELEAAAANPETRRLLPENALSMIDTIRQLLLQQYKEKGEQNDKPTFQPTEED